MRVLVCGSRRFKDADKLNNTLDLFPISRIIHGCASGADTLAGDYARRHNIATEEFPALWKQYGRKAGPIRNKQMLVEGNPELVIAFLAPNSRGTINMIEQANRTGVKVHIVNIDC